jgi:hypothetical protein
MDLEQQLRETYAERLDGVDASGDVTAARRAGERMRVRRRLAAGAAAVAVVAVAAAGSLVGTGRVSLGPSGSRGEWRELPSAPLSPRAYSLGVWTGREAIVLGGESKPCPPNVDFTCSAGELRDGAAYDPRTNTWQRIAKAPVPVGPGDRLLSAAGRVILRHAQPHGSRLFVYDPATNEWFEIPSFLQDLPSAYGDDVYGLGNDHAHRGQVVMYDARAGTWNERIPRDPIRPRLNQPRVTATPYGPVVTGYPAASGRGLRPVTADLYDGTSWRRLPPTNVTGNDWAWVGDRMIDFDSFAHQGTDVQPGGLQAGGQLDPSTGRWNPLPGSTLETPPDPWSPVAIGPGGWAACWGLVYDVRNGRAWTLPRPQGALDSSTTAAWIGDRLLVFGGATLGIEESLADTSNQAWLYTP